MTKSITAAVSSSQWRYIAAAAVLLAAVPGSAAHADTPKPQADPAVSRVASPAEEARDLLRRGDELTAGVKVPRDLEAALQFYRRAAALGDRKAKQRLGAALVLGRGAPPDVAGGLELLNEAADAGDPNAMIQLGEFYAKGLAGTSERHRAIAAYERAAAAGQSLAFTKLGDIYRTGGLVPQDSRKAAAYYRQAADAGRTGALVLLGKGILNGSLRGVGTQADAIAMLRDANKAGIPDAAVALSDCYLNGNAVRENPRIAIRILRQAADNGNIAAGRRLVSIYRDGAKKRINRDRGEAARYLGIIEARLSPADLQVERLLMQASEASGTADYGRVQEAFDEIPPASRQSVIRKIRSVNANVFFYLVQARLGGMGLYDGHVSGKLSRRTVKAVYRYCASREKPDLCKRGPLTGIMTNVLATAF